VSGCCAPRSLPMVRRPAPTLGARLLSHRVSGQMQHAKDVTTPLDAAIPFLGWTVWIYLSGIALIVMPVFVLGDNGFRGAALSYALTHVGSFACFAVMPVSSAHLRESADTGNYFTLTAWAIRVLYDVDPPYNLFPSLHVSLSTLACWSMAAAHRRWRCVFVTAICLISVSALTTKQHLVLDVMGGLALAWAMHVLISFPRSHPAALFASAACLASVTFLFGLSY
jgi:membrane-associated phospholipid phosphatase